MDTQVRSDKQLRSHIKRTVWHYMADWLHLCSCLCSLLLLSNLGFKNIQLSGFIRTLLVCSNNLPLSDLSPACLNKSSSSFQVERLPLMATAPDQLKYLYLEIQIFSSFSASFLKPSAAPSCFSDQSESGSKWYLWSEVVLEQDDFRITTEAIVCRLPGWVYSRSSGDQSGVCTCFLPTYPLTGTD